MYRQTADTSCRYTAAQRIENYFFSFFLNIAKDNEEEKNTFGVLCLKIVNCARAFTCACS
nr:MAG TPA: hypothetical protein [Microviridae sp.]